MTSFSTVFALTFIRLWTVIYEIVTWPLYYIFKDKRNYAPINPQDPVCQGDVLAVPTLEGDPASPWRNLKSMRTLTTSPLPGCITLDDLFYQCAEKHPGRPCLGTREVLKKEMLAQPNGRHFQKLTLGNYTWETFAQVHRRIDNFGYGLAELGLFALTMHPRTQRK